MMVSSSALELALFNIFRDLRLTQQQPIPFAELEAHWGGTGFRMSDLRDGIRILLEHELLDTSDDYPELAFQLTESGMHRLKHPVRSLGELPGLAGDAFTLLKARQRPWDPTRPSQERRRTTDPVAPAHGLGGALRGR